MAVALEPPCPLSPLPNITNISFRRNRITEKSTLNNVNNNNNQFKKNKPVKRISHKLHKIMIVHISRCGSEQQKIVIVCGKIATGENYKKKLHALIRRGSEISSFCNTVHPTPTYTYIQQLLLLFSCCFNSFFVNRKNTPHKNMQKTKN
jgi:hypothetical protein